MTNWGGILATVAGGGVAGAGEGWAKDIKSRKEDARETRRQKALETRQTNITNLRQKYNVDNINLGDTLDRKRGTDEFNRKQTADETNYNRRMGEEELTFQRRMKEKLESEKQLIQMKQGTGDSVKATAKLKAIEMSLGIIEANRNNITPDVIAQINDIRTTANLNPLEYRPTGQKVKDEDTGFLGFGKKDKDVYGFFPSGDTQGEGILSGGESVKQPKPNVGNVELDDLFTAVTKPPEDTTSKSPDVDTSDISASEITGTVDEDVKNKPLLSSKKDVPYDVKMGEGPTKSQYDAAHQELINLAKKLGLESTIDLKNVTPGSEEFDMVISAAKKAGGVIWDQIKQLVNTLGQSQAEARKGLTAYK